MVPGLTKFAPNFSSGVPLHRHSETPVPPVSASPCGKFRRGEDQFRNLPLSMAQA